MSDILLGKVGSNSHPVHPATVHLPIAFLLTASVLDIFYTLTVYFPSLLIPFVALPTSGKSSTSTLDYISVYHNIALFSFVSTIAALITSFPAITSGVVELQALISANGLDFKNQKVKVAVIHAALNDLAVAGTAYNWWSKRSRTAYAVDGMNCAISGIILGGVLYSAMLGGSLVYKHGMAVQRMGEGKQLKEQEIAKLKAEERKGQ